MSRRSSRSKYMVEFIVLILAGLASWALFTALNQFVADFLLFYGIENLYMQSAIIISVVVVVFLTLGLSGEKIVRYLAG